MITSTVSYSDMNKRNINLYEIESVHSESDCKINIEFRPLKTYKNIQF